MSSRVVVGLVEAPGVGVECAVDDVGQVALEDAEGGFSGFAAGFGAALQQGDGGGVAAGLGDGGAVDRCVDLAVAAAVEPLRAVAAGAAGGGNRGGAVVAGVGGGAAEAADVAGLAEDAGGGDCPDPADVQQGGAQVFQQGAELGFQGADIG